MNIDEQVNALVEPLAKVVSEVIFFKLPLMGADLPLVVIWLVIAAVFFTFSFGFINIRGFSHALELVRGQVGSRKNPPGEVSHFQALTTAVSGTVGIGNIGGVAAAISLGGPGAAFWMILAGFLGMSTKFVECTLGVKYRRENPDGSVSGGPMYFMEHGLAERGLAMLGKGLGIFYAVGIVIGCMGIGNMFQSNQAFVQFVNVTGENNSWFADKGWLFGLVMAVMVALVIIGGIKSIARVTEKLVPFMAVLYVFSALVIISINYEALPYAFQAMFTQAFSSQGVAGGALGAMIVGFQRAVFSNEAGIGSASIAHSAVRTHEPVTEGYVALLEPFIDTVIICTLTALVIITTMYYVPGFTQGGLGGIEMTSAAFERNISWSPIPLSIAAMLFAFSTMLAWSYYGLKGWTYLVGEGRIADIGFKLVFCSFVALGCMIELKAVLDFSDAMVFVICVPNILALYLLAPVVKAEIRQYQNKPTVKI